MGCKKEGAYENLSGGNRKKKGGEEFEEASLRSKGRKKSSEGWPPAPKKHCPRRGGERNTPRLKGGKKGRCATVEQRLKKKKKHSGGRLD